MALDPSQFVTRNPLDALSIKQVVDAKQFIFDEVYTPVYVDKSSVKVYHYDTSHMKEVETRAHSKAKAKKVDYGVFTRNVDLVLHKLAGDVDPKDEANADEAVADQEMDQAENIMSRLLIKRERLMVEAVGTTSNYPSASVRSLLAGGTWADADGNPEADIAAIKEAVWALCGTEPRAMAIGQIGLWRLRQSPALKSRLHYSNNGKMISLEELKGLFDLDEINVCRARYDSAAKGLTATTAEIWDDFALVYVKAPSQNRRQMRFAANYIRRQLYTYKYQDDERGSGDGRIQVTEKGWEYVPAAGAVVSSSDGDFAAGGIVDNIY